MLGWEDNIYSFLKGVAGLGQMDMSKWRKLDSRTLGIAQKSISESSWIVLKILQSAGDLLFLSVSVSLSLSE